MAKRAAPLPEDKLRFIEPMYAETVHQLPDGGDWSYEATMWALTADEMKECNWLKPKLVAQIEFTEWTPDAISGTQPTPVSVRIKRRGT